MRYIKSLRLINFQSHKDTEIELDPGINLIVGTSHAGKSALLRGLNLLFHNEPRGKSFIRKGTDEAFVSIVFNDGYEITRIKGESRNAILITSPTGLVKAYERIGDKLPQEAIDILGNPPISKDHGPISYAEQFAPFFLVGLTPTELPRSLSELTGINDFEEAAKRLASDARRADNKAKDSSQRINAYQSDLEQYQDLDKQLDYLSKLEKWSDAVDDCGKKYDNALELQLRYSEIYDMGKQVANTLVRSKKLSVLESDLNPALNLRDKLQTANSILESEIHLKSFEKNLLEDFKRTSAILIDDTNSQILCAVQISNQIAGIYSVLDTYRDIMEQARSTKKFLDDWKKDIIIYESHYQNITEEMKNNGMWCDNCQRPLLLKSESCHKHEKH